MIVIFSLSFTMFKPYPISWNFIFSLIIGPFFRELRISLHLFFINFLDLLLFKITPLQVFKIVHYFISSLFIPLLILPKANFPSKLPTIFNFILPLIILYIILLNLSTGFFGKYLINLNHFFSFFLNLFFKLHFSF